MSETDRRDGPQGPPAPGAAPEAGRPESQERQLGAWEGYREEVLDALDA